MLRVAVVGALDQVADPNVPAARPVVVVIAGEQVHKRVDADVEGVAQAGDEDFQVGPIGPDADDAAAHRHPAAILALGLRTAIVADGDVDPAVESHADAIGGVVAAALVDHVAGQASDEDFRLVGDALAAVVVDAEEGRVQNPEPAVLIDQAARVVHLGEHRDFIDLAVAVLIDAAQHLAAAGRPADRPLLIDGDE